MALVRVRSREPASRRLLGGVQFTGRRLRQRFERRRQGGFGRDGGVATKTSRARRRVGIERGRRALVRRLGARETHRSRRHRGGDEIDKGKKDSVLKKEYSEIAERRVRLGLLMAEIGDVNKIIVTEDEIKTAVMQEARKYPGEENKVIEFYQKNPEAANAVKAPLFEEKVVDHIISKCSIKDIKVTSEKLYEDNVIADPTAKSKNKTKSKTTKTSKSVKAKPKK